MTIDILFDKNEQDEIQRRVTEFKREFESKKVAKNQRHYFAELADSYRLSIRLARQLDSYERMQIGSITTNAEIAGLFGVDYSSVTLYLKERISEETYKRRVRLCLEIGGKNGGESCKDSPTSNQYGKNGKTHHKNT